MSRAKQVLAVIKMQFKKVAKFLSWFYAYQTFEPNKLKTKTMTQQTIEEASEYYAHNYFNMHELNHYKALKQGFKEGAKWQQEQDKNNYNEQDMITAIQYTINNFFNGKLAGLNSEEIFEQFKKK